MVAGRRVENGREKWTKRRKREQERWNRLERNTSGRLGYPGKWWTPDAEGRTTDWSRYMSEDATIKRNEDKEESQRATTRMVDGWIKENIESFFIFINKTSPWRGKRSGKRDEWTRRVTEKWHSPLNGTTVCDYFWITTKCKVADSGWGGWGTIRQLFLNSSSSLTSQDRKLFLRVPTTGKSLFLKIFFLFFSLWLAATLLHGGVNPSPGKISPPFAARFVCPSFPSEGRTLGWSLPACQQKIRVPRVV